MRDWSCIDESESLCSNTVLFTRGRDLNKHSMKHRDSRDTYEMLAEKRPWARCDVAPQFCFREWFCTWGGTSPVVSSSLIWRPGWGRAFSRLLPAPQTLIKTELAPCSCGAWPLDLSVAVSTWQIPARCSVSDSWHTTHVWNQQCSPDSHDQSSSLTNDSYKPLLILKKLRKGHVCILSSFIHQQEPCDGPRGSIWGVAVHCSVTQQRYLPWWKGNAMSQWQFT